MTHEHASARLSVSALSHVRNFEFYTETIRSSFGLPLEFTRSSGRRDADFKAEVRMTDIGAASVGFIECDDYSARMPFNERTRETVSFVFLERGKTGIHQDGRYALMKPGQLFFFDTSRAADFHFFTHFRQHVLHLPKAELCRRCPGVERYTSIALSCTGTLALLRNLLRAFGDGAPEASNEAFGEVSDLLISLAVLGLSDRMQSANAQPPSKAARRMLVEDHLRKHLGDAMLSVPRIADACRMSPRALQELFSDEDGGGVMHSLWLMRLDQARLMLSSPWHAGLKIAEIGYACGFKSQAHFSDRFKHAYGETPGAYRKRMTAAPAERLPAMEKERF